MYRFEGCVLGGRSEILENDEAYLQALERLVSWASDQSIAIFCAEGDPAQCHRSWSVGAALLRRYGIVTRSILRNNEEEDITATLRRVP
jgi:hypothetical protein